MRLRPLSVSWVGSDSGILTIPNPISVPQDKSLFLGVKKMSTYNGFRNVNTDNKIFTYTSATPAPGTVHTITITPGIYNIATLNSAIQQGMLNIGESQAQVDLFKIQIYTPNVGTTITTPFKIDFTVPKSINTLIGFNATVLPGPTPPATTAFYISQNAANITDNDYVQITASCVADGFSKNFLTKTNQGSGITNETLVGTSVLYGFTVNNSPGGLIQYTEANPIYVPSQFASVPNIQFKLINKYGQLADNADQTFTLDIIFIEGEKIM